MGRWGRSLIVLFFTLCLSGQASVPAHDHERAVRVLSIDGGGVRGLIAAVVLEEIEKEIGRPLANIFDFVAGTSTGGMLALAVAAPGREGRPSLTAEEMVDVYFNESAHIFSSSYKHWLATLGGLLGPKYESSGLSNLLYEQFGDTLLSQALIPTLITGYHLEGQTGIEFFSETAKAYPQDKDCLMREVGLATAAAPVYFDSVDVNFAWGSLNAIADGGLYKYDPALLAYVNARRLFPHRKIEVYSLGTGKYNAEDLNAQFKGRGLLHWLKPIMKHINIGSSEADNSALHRLLNEDGEENYFRLNVVLDRGHNNMDDHRGENVDYLYEKGLQITETPIFREMIRRLKS